MICGQIVCWIMSAYMLRFELQRNLGHVWYMHYLYTWLSAAVYLSDFLITFILGDITFENASKLDLAQLLSTLVLMIISLVIASLIIAYPRDMPYGGRDYVPGILPADGVPNPFPNEDRHMSISTTSTDVRNKKKVPIITAKLSSSVKIDKDGGVYY